MSPLSVVHDWPEELRFLLSDDADGLLGAYAAHLGATLVSARPRQVIHRPARSTTVQYRVELESPDGATTQETYIAQCGTKPVTGTTVLKAGSTTASVWNWRHDPALPGLGDALDRRRVDELFRDLGLSRGDIRLRVRAYSPGRRAVVEANNAGHRLFLKIVRPDRVEQLHTLHRQLATHMAVPDSLGWTDHGVMVLPAVPGVTLRDALRRGDGALPEPSSISEMLATLPSDVGRSTPRAHWLDETRRHARVIEATVPSVRDRLLETVERIARLDEPHDAHDQVMIHGDLHEAQLIIDGAHIVGLLDVDTLGVGRPVDDAANFCAHLSVLATVDTSAHHINRYGARVLADAERRFDRRHLRTRIAAATLGLATGPFRTLEPNWKTNTRTRIDLANQWLDSVDHRRSA